MTLEATFATACDRLLGAEFSENIGIAVSGGGDSTALLVLACGRFGGARITAPSVDHGLRPEAARELALVATLCAQQGFAHEVLAWQSAEARGKQQAEARAARYALMADRAVGFTATALAPTTVLRLPPEDFRRLCRLLPTFREAMAEAAAADGADPADFQL